MINLDACLTLFWTQIQETPVLQWIGVFFAVTQVLLAKSNNVWLYPSGIISVAIASYALFISGLYAESLLNIYYLIMSVYGWWHWESDNNSSAKADYCNKKELLTAFLIVACSFAALYPVLLYFTDSDVPVWDTWVSAWAWAGMWLLARRRIENWIFLNVSNAFAVPLLLHKELPLYSALTLFLFVVAVFGYCEWKKIIQNNPS